MSEMRHYGVPGMRWGVIRKIGPDGLILGSSVRDKDKTAPFQKPTFEKRLSLGKNSDREAAIKKGEEVRAANQKRMVEEAAAKKAAKGGETGGKGRSGSAKKKEDPDKSTKQSSRTPQAVSKAVESVGSQRIVKYKTKGADFTARRTIDLLSKSYGSTRFSSILRMEYDAGKK